MEKLRINLIFNNYLRSSFNRLEISMDREDYLMTKALNRRLIARKILSLIIIGGLIFLSKFILEPRLSPLIGRTGSLLVFLGLNIVAIYLVSYSLIPKNLEGYLTRIEKD